MSDQLSKRYLHTGAAPVSPCASIQAQAAPREYPAIESAATPAEVAPIAWRFDYCGVKPMVWLEKPAENAPMFTNIRALVYADDYATLAHQLAEAKAEIAALSDDVAEYQRNIDAESFALTKAESALAEATRRLGEVEGLLNRAHEWLSSYGIAGALRGEIEDALQKEPK